MLLHDPTPEIQSKLSTYKTVAMCSSNPSWLRIKECSPWPKSTLKTVWPLHFHWLLLEATHKIILSLMLLMLAKLIRISKPTKNSRSSIQKPSSPPQSNLTLRQTTLPTPISFSNQFNRKQKNRLL